MNEYFEIEKKLGLTFKNPKLLESALTHSSLRLENEFLESNEILEFVGDSVMYFIITVHLYKNLGINKNSGDFSIIRSNIISNETFTKFAKKLSLENHIKVSKGQNKAGITDAMLSNCFEALIGAIYIDAGITKVKTFFWNNYTNEIKNLIKQGPLKNTKMIKNEQKQKSMQD